MIRGIDLREEKLTLLFFEFVRVVGLDFLERLYRVLTIVFEPSGIEAFKFLELLLFGLANP